HVLQAVNGHLIGGYSADGDAPAEQVTLMPGAVERAEEFLAAHPETGERFARVAQLVDGFETPFGLELLGTTHWVAVNEGTADEQEATIERFYAWGPTKAQFTREQIELALERLQDGGWLVAAAD